MHVYWVVNCNVKSTVVYLGDCGASLRGEVYDLDHFHLHAPSEHTIYGKHMDGEIHFVHMNSDTEALLVVGVFLEIGPVSDKWMGPVLDALELVNSTAVTDTIVVDLYVTHDTGQHSI